MIENFKTGGAAKLGVDYESVRARNPDVVYCSISGFGSEREPAGRPGYDFVAQAETGLMSITGPEDGPPFKVGVALVDVLAGLHAAVAILAALGGEGGGQIEVPLLDSGLAGLVNVAQNALVTGRSPNVTATPTRTSFPTRTSRPPAPGASRSRRRTTACSGHCAARSGWTGCPRTSASRPTPTGSSTAPS